MDIVDESANEDKQETKQELCTSNCFLNVEKKFQQHQDNVTSFDL